jgi:hypothetical protein
LSGRQTANELLRALLLGDARVVWRTPAGEFQREFAPGGRDLKGILSGSFNPRHDGHTQLREVAERQLKGTVAYEISIRNVDKPPLDYVSLESRAAQFADAPLAFTNAPTFVEKSRVFPGCAFVVGTDTAERLVDPKYYGGDQQRMLSALAEIAQSGCRFLVAGRKADDRFESLADLILPAAFAPLFTGISEQEFRVDRSSTEIRRSAISSD